MKKILIIIVLTVWAQLVFAQFAPVQTTNMQFQNTASKDVLSKSIATPHHLYYQPEISALMEPEPETSLAMELVYIAAMETVFTGMSYMASRDEGYGPALAGGFDVFMGVAGFRNGLHKEPGIHRVGYFALTLGFLTKALYNFQLGEQHTGKVRFWVNLIGNNALVFSGYYLDSLE